MSVYKEPNFDNVGVHSITRNAHTIEKMAVLKLTKRPKVESPRPKCTLETREAIERILCIIRQPVPRILKSLKKITSKTDRGRPWRHDPWDIMPKLETTPTDRLPAITARFAAQFKPERCNHPYAAEVLKGAL